MISIHDDGDNDYDTVPTTHAVIYCPVNIGFTSVELFVEDTFETENLKNHRERMISMINDFDCSTVHLEK